jgi:Ca2+-transporting ATPase
LTRGAGPDETGAQRELRLGTPVQAEPLDALLERLDVGSGQGLDESEAAKRLLEYGPNKLPDPPREPAWRRFLAQFTDPLVLTLLAAAAVAVLVAVSGAEAQPGASWLSRFADAIAILLIVIINAVIGYYQEQRAEAALDALQKLAAPHARVRRSGKLLDLMAEQLVPGDLLELEAGDAVPADARLVQTIDLATEESALTGESVPTGKDALAVVGDHAALGDCDNMVFTGTTVVRGKGRAVVTSTGPGTELGRIGQMIASIGDQKTPLEERLEAFGKLILWVCLSLSAVLMLWGFARPMVFGGAARAWHELLLEAVALAVAAIPEGLPAITTITLALGMQRMARRGGWAPLHRHR